MRVWDVPAGHLNRQSLLGEHRELHGIYVIVSEGKRGYSNHPETRRWTGALTGLVWRHAQLVAEMQLRGFVDRTPLPVPPGPPTWPDTFVTEPGDQFALLTRKYAAAQKGRIPLPRNAQELWAQCKYSALARDPGAYRRIGRAVAAMRGRSHMRELARDLVLLLRERPSAGRLCNALEHMWGHVSDIAHADDARAIERGPGALLAVIQALAIRGRDRFLLSSTALSELAVGLDGRA